MSSNGHTRGYAHCTYTNMGYAVKAIRYFNNFEIRPLSKIFVAPTRDNNILYIGYVALDKTDQEIYRELRKIFGGITSIALYVIHQKNCLAVEVKFESHLFSSYAKEFVLSGCVHLFGERLTEVYWANYDHNNIAITELQLGCRYFIVSELSAIEKHYLDETFSSALLFKFRTNNPSGSSC
ncbi:hypothetical protein CEXT_99911 [Caerostris extrusa]|uniref:Uncharacterized protein n=1 Tax=Caerostris extrusa TaxID=172846 RepID=A0AAV4XUJ5_CAEEX|nr:hypothetical protein CEXT_99911 [Caerostris extrusa]